MIASRKLLGFATVSVFTIALTGAAASAATNYTYDVAPSDLVPKSQFIGPHGGGTNPLAYDSDSARPGAAAGAPTGFGDSSFFASVDESGATQADRYRTLRIGLHGLAGPSNTNITVGDIAGFSYQTKKGVLDSYPTAIDWRPSIYTTPIDKASDANDKLLGSGDATTWYRNRIQAFTYEAAGLNAPADQWNTWSTEGSENALRFSVNRSGFTTANITWEELSDGAVTRGANTWDFRTEQVMMIDFSLGANSGGSTIASQLDAIVIHLKNGDSVTLNLVPEPTSLAVLGLGGAALLGRRRKA